METLNLYDFAKNHILIKDGMVNRHFNDHEHWKQLIDKEGFRYFWWDNRLSFNLNHNNEYRGIRDLLKGYAFDGKHHEFLTQIN